MSGVTRYSSVEAGHVSLSNLLRVLVGDFVLAHEHAAHVNWGIVDEEREADHRQRISGLQDWKG